MSKSTFDSVEMSLEANIPATELKEVKRILYGKELRKLVLPQSALVAALERDFDLHGYVFEAEPEQIRAARTVRVGLIQNKIVLPTDAPVLEQITALHKRVGEMVDVAAACGVNIVCFQEAWTLLNAFHDLPHLPSYFAPVLPCPCDSCTPSQGIYFLAAQQNWPWGWVDGALSPLHS
uniref:Ureidopropionase, beta n=1 Tax=Astyanax mexicanus TaxID=7994 RepID=A0A8B9JTY5_ASTMX